VGETDKPLRVLCAEAEGWTGCVQFDGSDRWWGWPPRLQAPQAARLRVESTLEELPPYGEDTSNGQALAVQMMETHKISMQYIHADPAPMRWSAFVRLHDPVITAWGATIPEAVAWCRVAMELADRD